MNLEFPISIGLIGAPGSGKQPLAEEFTRISADYFAEQKSEFVTIPNAGRTIEETFDHAMGNFGSFTDSLWACFTRFDAEVRASQKGLSYLSCGTAVEHIAHAGVTLENLLTGVATPDVEARVRAGQITMSQLTLLWNEQFRAYTFGFYVPNAGSQLIVPGGDDTERNFNARVDQGIRSILSNFGIRIQVLGQPTIEEKAEEMLSTIKRIMESGPELPDELVEIEVVEEVPPAEPVTLSE